MTLGYASIHDSPTGLSVNCEDFDVEFFGGSDYEFTYTLDKHNRDKLWRILKSKNADGAMEDMVREYFGVSLEKTPFGGFCDEYGIKYDLFTWVS